MTWQLPTWLPPELGSMLLGMTPLAELQGAIPFGLAFGLAPWEAFLFGELGNAVPMLLVFGLGKVWIEWVEKQRNPVERFFHRATKWFTHRAQNKLNADVSRWGLLGLMLFVSLPFPGAGTWTGSVGAFLMGVPFKKVWPYILAGNIINGLLVTLAATGAVKLFELWL